MLSPDKAAIQTYLLHDTRSERPLWVGERPAGSQNSYEFRNAFGMVAKAGLLSPDLGRAA